jgi:hypothetical protein
MTRPLQLMLKKDADPWTEKQTHAVRQLKTATQNLPALVIPSTGHRILQTDASDQYWMLSFLKIKMATDTYVVTKAGLSRSQKLTITPLSRKY